MFRRRASKCLFAASVVGVASAWGVSLEQPVRGECLCLLIERGLTEPAAALFQESFSNASQAEHRRILSSLQNTLKGLESFQKVINTKRRVSKIEPVFQWGQSKSNVLVQVKFAHRFDSPGCLNLNNERVQIEGQSIRLFAQGIQAHQPIDFQLHLQLFQDILPQMSTYRFESVGKMSFNLTKKENSIWNRLSLPERKEQIWWEMKSIYKEDMLRFAELKEKEEDLAAQAERKRRLAKQKQQREEQERHRKVVQNINEKKAKVEEQEKDFETKQRDAIEKLQKDLENIEQRSKEKQEKLIYDLKEGL